MNKERESSGNSAAPESDQHASHGNKFPRRLLYILLYMAFAYLLGIGAMQWAKRHPVIDERSSESATIQQ